MLIICHKRSRCFYIFSDYDGFRKARERAHERARELERARERVRERARKRARERTRAREREHADDLHAGQGAGPSASIRGLRKSGTASLWLCLSEWPDRRWPRKSEGPPSSQ